MNSYSNKKDYIQRLEEAGDTSGRTQKQADDAAKIDQIFEPQKDDGLNQDDDWVDQIFDFTQKLFN